MRLKHPRMLIALAGLAACNSAMVPPQDPAELVVLKQVPAITTPGSTVEEISVRVLSSSGRPVPDQLVEWQGDGEVVPVNSRTDELGISSARWTLPQYTEFNIRPHGPSGTHVATASVAGLSSVIFETDTRAFIVDHFDATSSYGCGVRAGDLWCWGGLPWPIDQQYRHSRPARVELPSGTIAAEVRVTGTHVCVLDQAGIAHCFGFGWPVFTTVSGAPSLRGMVKGGEYFNNPRFCGRSRADDTVWCWIPDATTPGTARQVSPVPFAAITTSFDFGCGLDLGGDAWCWGNNDYGQLGDGTNVESVVPVRVVGVSQFATLSAGLHGACGSTTSREVWCWGGIGPLAVGSNTPVRVTVPGVAGSHVYVSGAGDGYVIDQGNLRIWYATFTLDLFALANKSPVREVAGDTQMCVQTVSGEIFCSWILLRGGGDTSPWPSELLPVPDPASGRGS